MPISLPRGMACTMPPYLNRILPRGCEQCQEKRAELKCLARKSVRCALRLCCVSACARGQSTSCACMFCRKWACAKEYGFAHTHVRAALQKNAHKSRIQACNCIHMPKRTSHKSHLPVCSRAEHHPNSCANGAPHNARMLYHKPPIFAPIGNKPSKACKVFRNAAGEIDMRRRRCYTLRVNSIWDAGFRAFGRGSKGKPVQIRYNSHYCVWQKAAVCHWIISEKAPPGRLAGHESGDLPCS